MHKKTTPIPRQLASHLLQLSESYGVISLTGPRQSGKTTLCKQVFHQLPYLNLEDPQWREFAATDPKGLLAQYPQGAIIDEIQRVPELTSYLQVRVDEPDFHGTYVLTGSQNFQIRNTLSQSLAGRVGLATLLPFSLHELSYSAVTDKFSVNDYLYTGFYPRIYDKQMNPSQAYADYVATYIERDIRQLEFVKDLFTFQKFVKICAGRIGQLLNKDSLANDVGVGTSTIEQWLTLLEASYILFRLPPFYENIGKRLIKSPKIYFYDVGLAAYLLGIEDISQIPTHPLRGNLFENMVVTDILKSRHHQLQRANLFFYRDSNGNEVDLLIPHANNYLAIEVKSSATIHKEFFKGLTRFAQATEKLKNRYLIYGGNEAHKQYETNILPVLSLRNQSPF